MPNGWSRTQKILGSIATLIIIAGSVLSVGLWALDTRYGPEAMDARYVSKAEWDEVVPHIHYTSCALRANQRGIDPELCLFHLPPDDRARLMPRNE